MMRSPLTCVLLAASLLAIGAGVATASAQTSGLDNLLANSAGNDVDAARLMQSIGADALGETVELTPPLLDKFLVGAKAGAAEWSRLSVLEKYQECEAAANQDQDGVVYKLRSAYNGAENDENKAEMTRLKKAIPVALAKKCGAEPAGWDDSGPLGVYTNTAVRASGLTEDTYTMVRERVIAFLLMRGKSRGKDMSRYTFKPAELALLKQREPQLRAALAKDLEIEWTY